MSTSTCISTEHFLGNLYTCQDAVFLDQEVALAHSILRDTTQRGVVAIADILCKSEVYQSVVQFFYA